MAVASSLFPVTGLTLPLVSMGGTSIIFTSAAFGVLLSVSRTVEEQNNQTETNIANNEGN
jgi:cell division protein FtsW